jgi:glyoxylase-like metal-dependent hydrolase (beta-lactamase superfamily II)
MVSTLEALSRSASRQPAQGVWRIELPLPDIEVTGVAVYVLETDDGLVLVDAGFHADAARTALEHGLAALGASVEDITGVLLTHAHPDHHGLAAEVRERSGAWTALHERDAASLGMAGGAWAAALDRWRHWLAAVGVPAAREGEFVDLSAEMLDRWRTPRPSLWFADGWRAPFGDVVAVPTPGHSNGHVAFHDRERGLLFGGDLLLAGVLTSLPANPLTQPDPIQAYLRSLRRVEALGASLVLPGHGPEFAGVRAEARAARTTLSRRLARVAQVIGHGPATAWEVAERIPRRVPLTSFSLLAQRAAAGEALGVLHALERGGCAVRVGGPGPAIRWAYRSPM